MGDEVIAIHNITNEMVKEAPNIKEQIQNISNFLSQGHLVAHHAAFDLGFLSVEWEKFDMPLPSSQYIFCTSILSRVAFPNSPNYRMQTLVKELGIEMGTAHRAVADSRACLQVFKKCVEVLKVDCAKELFEIQKNQISKEHKEHGNDVSDNKMIWKRFSLNELKKTPRYSSLVESVQEQIPVNITYGFSGEGKKRQILSKGIVRSLGADYVVAFDYPKKGKIPKKFYLKKIEMSSF